MNEISSFGRGTWLQDGMRRLCHRIVGWAIAGPFVFALIAVFVLMAASIAIFQIGYDTNDDVFLTMIASGKGICHAPDDHLIFTNVVIGQALKWLYETWPAFPWYGCYLLTIHYLAQATLLYCALTIDRKPSTALDPITRRSAIGRQLLLYLIYFAVVELLLLNNLQFTSTAFLAGQSGALVCLVALRQQKLPPGTVRWGLIVCGVSFLVMASLVRLECFYLTAHRFDSCDRVSDRLAAFTAASTHRRSGCRRLCSHRLWPHGVQQELLPARPGMARFLKLQPAADQI